MARTPNPAPGFRRRPEHRITYTRFAGTVCATVGEEVVGESARALLCEETGHDPVFYLPMVDCAVDRLRPTVRKTRCPFKGEASHWTLALDGGRVENAAWSYDTPYDEALAVEGHVAFYPDKVTVTAG